MERRTSPLAREWTEAVTTGPSVPGLDTLRRYRRAWLRPDVIAGVTVAAYLVPQCMAYAGVAGLPAVVGLWAALAPLVLYAVLGTSRQLSVGPESTTAVMTASAVAPLAGGDPATYVVLAAGLAVCVGLVCLLAWLLKLGFLADLLSRPVLVGYMAGVAVLMITGQLTRVTGVPVSGDTVVEEIQSFFGNLDELDLTTTLLALSVVAFLALTERLWPRAPGPLLAVVLSSIVVAVLNLEEAGVAVVGPIPAGLPSLSWPSVSSSDLGPLFAASIGVAIVGYTDNVLTARAFALRKGQRIDANQELLALGAANIGAGVTQGFPVSSSGSRTAIVDAVGGTTQLVSLVAAACVLVVLVAARNVLSLFPEAALGAIVIHAAIKLVDVPELRRLGRFRRSELALAIAAGVAVLAFGVLVGILIAVGLSVIDLFARVARPHSSVLGKVPGLAGLHNVKDFPDATTTPGLVVFRYDAPLCFANAEYFRQRCIGAVRAADHPVEWFLLNAEAIVEIDATAVAAIEDVRVELEDRGITFAMARVKQSLMQQIDKAGLLDRVGRDRIYPTLPTAAEAFENRERRPR